MEFVVASLQFDYDGSTVFIDSEQIDPIIYARVHIVRPEPSPTRHRRGKRGFRNASRCPRSRARANDRAVVRVHSRRCVLAAWFPLPYSGGVSSPLKYSPPGAFSLATFALDDSAWLWPNARREPEPLFVAAKQLTPSAGHPFNQKLNQLLDEDRVDAPLQEDSTC